MSQRLPPPNSAARQFAKAALLGVWDIIDRVGLKITGQSELPPYSLRRHVAPLDRFVPSSEEYIAYFKLLGGLSMSDRILDIGCGVGRFAQRLVMNPHYFRGSYHGFDPSRECVAWAKAHIGSPLAKLEFQHVDLFNGYYNPTGAIKPNRFEFPFEDGKFDFIFAWSVFTHLLPGDASQYLREIRRTLKPGKKAIFTTLLIDGPVASLRSDLIERRQLAMEPRRWHHHGVYAVMDEARPEFAVAFQREWMLAEIAAAGLELIDLRNGAWDNDEAYLSEQDLVVVARPL